MHRDSPSGTFQRRLIVTTDEAIGRLPGSFRGRQAAWKQPSAVGHTAPDVPGVASAACMPAIVLRRARPAKSRLTSRLAPLADVPGQRVATSGMLRLIGGAPKCRIDCLHRGAVAAMIIGPLPMMYQVSPDRCRGWRAVRSRRVRRVRPHPVRERGAGLDVRLRGRGAARDIRRRTGAAVQPRGARDAAATVFEPSGDPHHGRGPARRRATKGRDTVPRRGRPDSNYPRGSVRGRRVHRRRRREGTPGAGTGHPERVRAPRRRDRRKHRRRTLRPGDQTIVDSQRRLAECLAVERSALWELANPEGDEFVYTHVWSADPAVPLPPGAPARRHALPVGAVAAARGRSVSFAAGTRFRPHRPEELSDPRRQVERIRPAHWCGGKIMGVLTFAAITTERSWSGMRGGSPAARGQRVCRKQPRSPASAPAGARSAHSPKYGV